MAGRVLPVRRSYALSRALSPIGLEPYRLHPARLQRVPAQHLGAVDEELAQVLVPLNEAQLCAAQHGHVAAQLFQVVHRRAELCHIGAFALLDVVINDRHDLLLVLRRRYRPVNALRLAGKLIRLGGQRAVRCQNAQLCAACRLSIGHGQPRHVQHRHGQCLGQAVIKIVRRVAWNRQHRCAVVYQAEAILLHHSKRVILTFTHDERCAVRCRRAGRDDNVDMVLVARRGCVVDQHLIQITAGRGSQPSQDSQHLFLWFCLQRGTPLLIVHLQYIIRLTAQLCKGKGDGFREIPNKKRPAFSCKVSVVDPNFNSIILQTAPLPPLSKGGGAAAPEGFLPVADCFPLTSQ